METAGNLVVGMGNPWFGPGTVELGHAQKEARVASLSEYLLHLAVDDVADPNNNTTLSLPPTAKAHVWTTT